MKLKVKRFSDMGARTPSSGIFGETVEIEPKVGEYSTVEMFGIFHAFRSFNILSVDENGVTRKPEKENGKKFETLAVDLIKPMGSVLPFEVVREKEFAPIKNKTGVDSVESARELLKQNGVIL